MPASRPRQKNPESGAPPDLFAGKYRLVRMLGKGAMGEVWLAEEEGPRDFRRRVALKRLAPRPGVGDYAKESFFAEAQVIARLDHPNVIRLIELGTCEGSVYLALDYVDGPAIDRVLRKVGAFSPRAVAYIGREMARALDAVHNLCDDDGRSYAVVHRDVSPSNILIARDGRVRLTDFGVARMPGLADEQTDSGVFKGKLPYMPPEQARGEPFDGRADVFSLGITLLEALLGSRVRKADTQAQLILGVASAPIPRARVLLPDLHASLADALDAATEFDAAKRTPSAGQLASDLERVLLEMGQGAEREARSELKEKVEAYIARTGPVSGSGSLRPPSLPHALAPTQTPVGAMRRSAPSAAPATSTPAGRLLLPDEPRGSAPPGRGSGAPRASRARGSLSVNYLDFDGPEDAPVRSQIVARLPESELQRSGAAGDRASESGKSVAAAPAEGGGDDAEPEGEQLSDEQQRRKRRIFFAGLFVLGAIAASRLLTLVSC
ncbi:protein kinase [Sorangium cellulosum]|uniref:Protein kinase n=1 Tax=Sorangium cellulosum TaxID=56 RepID=A0A2L0F523_SORCE|nr:serine/threonine-protein kinase [Sorangium cellulosum]AUX46698.1 protein kinase [Sorangium cellulosum]